MAKKKLSRVINMNEYRLVYNKFVKDYCIESSNGEELTSIKYLYNKDNHPSWYEPRLVEYKKMFQWLKENHPEWII